jgi:hypothetical protein
MAGLLDDTDTARQTVPVEYLGYVVGYPAGRIDACRPLLRSLGYWRAFW